MLGFFRKYQKYFFVIITVVIIVSFSFFGTSGTLQRSQYVDKKAFTAIDGSDIGRQELEELVVFISTDSEDKLLLGGSWEANFLNDGVIKKDFISNGLAEILVQPYLKDFKEDLTLRHQREIRYQPYVHPQAQYLSATNVWSVVAPDIVTNLTALQSIEDPVSLEGFGIRSKLFAAERKFPSFHLRYVLKNQQNQYNWLAPDPALDQSDLSLFGYHTVNDWFGPRFTRLVAEFIHNSAIIAKKRGYEVSKSEVLADLYRNAEMSFQQNINNPKLGVASSSQYFDEQLRRMGLDRNKAINIWRKVMLFRRLFQDLGNSVLVDPVTIHEFHEYAKEVVQGDLFQLQEPLRFNNFRELQKLEIYLSAVSDRPKKGMELLELPETFKNVDKVKADFPELVQRRYLLDVGFVEKKSLQAKIGVRETWEWEVLDRSWKMLKKKFPELGTKPGATVEERYAALDSLDNKIRQRVDVYAREQMIEEHPDWLEEALENAPSERLTIGIRKKGENQIFPGMKDPEELIALLDSFPDSKSQLERYSPDQSTFYRIKVIDKSPGWEILTFAEASGDGTLDQLLDRTLEKHYEAIRSKDEKTYKNQDGSWKPIYQVRNFVAEDYFKNILYEINEYYTAVTTPSEKSKEMLPDYAASLRFFAFMRGLREQFRNDSDSIEDWVLIKEEEESSEALAPSRPLTDQWKIVRSDFKADRSAESFPISKDEAFTLKPDEWSTVSLRANGDLAFFQLIEKSPFSDVASFYEKVMQAHQLLSVDVQQVLMRQLVGEMEEKGALSLEFMEHGREQPEL